MRSNPIFTPQPDGEIVCEICSDIFTEAELAEFTEMGEAYYREKECFMCPDCWDAFQRMPLELSRIFIPGKT